METWDPDLDDDEPPEPTYETTNGSWRSIDGRFFELPFKRNREDGRGRSDVERIDQLAETMYKVARRIPKRSVYIGVRSVLTLRDLVDQLEYEVIGFARDNYWSWRMIGRELGVSGSAVHKRYAKARVKRRERRR